MRHDEASSNSLAGHSSKPAAERYRAVSTIAISVFIAFDVAFLGYLLTLSPWWFLLPVLTFALAWRRCYRAWPFVGSRR
jgi:hypothetical protein